MWGVEPASFRLAAERLAYHQAKPAQNWVFLESLTLFESVLAGKGSAPAVVPQTLWAGEGLMHTVE